jgi:hypothetical protein
MKQLFQTSAPQAKRAGMAERLARIQPLREAMVRRVLVVFSIVLPVDWVLAFWAGVAPTVKNLAGTLVLPVALGLFHLPCSRLAMSATICWNRGMG